MDSNDVSNISNLTNTIWWKTLKKILREEVYQLEYKIFNEFDNEIKYTSQDLNKLLRIKIIKLLETPTDLINEFK